MRCTGKDAELTVNTVTATPEAHAEAIVKYLRERGYLG